MLFELLEFLLPTNAKVKKMTTVSTVMHTDFIFIYYLKFLIINYLKKNIFVEWCVFEATQYILVLKLV
jgi:hypothetical protein